MSQQDLLSDALTRIRNGQMASHSFVTVPSSKVIKNSLALLEEEGYIRGYKEFEERKGVHSIKVALKYHRGMPAISEIKRVSKPGRRVYSKIKNVKSTYNGLGVTVVSTSHGLMADKKAKVLNVGGEILFAVF